MRTILLALCALFIAIGANAQDSYRVKPGDTLRIEVLEDPQLNREVLVLPDGRFSFPFAGTVTAAGRTISQIETAITADIQENFATPPNVFVSVGALRKREARAARGTGRTIRQLEVYLLGEVNKPGLLEVKRGTTLLQALAQGGGINRFGASKRVQLRRVDARTGKSSVHILNVKAIMDGAQAVPSFVLKAGDVIIVPERRLFE